MLKIQPFTQTNKLSPATDFPRVHPQRELPWKSQVTVPNPTLLTGPKELWILSAEPVHSDAPAKHRQFSFLILSEKPKGNTFVLRKVVLDISMCENPH